MGCWSGIVCTITVVTLYPGIACDMELGFSILGVSRGGTVGIVSRNFGDTVVAFSSWSALILNAARTWSLFGSISALLPSKRRK